MFGLVKKNLLNLQESITIGYILQLFTLEGDLEGKQKFKLESFFDSIIMYKL